MDLRGGIEVRVEEIRGTVNVEMLSKKIQENMLWWSGRVERFDEQLCQQDKFEIEVKRKRQIPKLLKDRIEEMEKPLDRKLWRPRLHGEAR